MPSKSIFVVAMLFVLVLVVALCINLHNNTELESILEDSVKAELLAVCFGASEVVSEHLDMFKAINSEDDIDRHREKFDAMIAKLQRLRDSTKVKYIYVLKKIGDRYYFIFDTDQEAIDGHDDSDPDTEGIVTEYTDIAEVHLKAFAGESSVGIMNARDEWGSYNTGAIPLHDPESGQVAGVIGIDIDDVFIGRAKQTAFSNVVLLAVVMALSMAVLFAVLFLLVRYNASMQAKLYRIANHDAITGLVNRYYLFNYLERKSRSFSASSPPFAVFFVDLDNFKRVNDSAGHDAGDELLRNIAAFLGASRQGHAASIQNPGNPGGDTLDAVTARIGGDEFLQITPGVASEEEAAAAAREMLAGFQAQDALQPFIRDFEVG
ncbi:MAG: GGDEF domain-containing protein, partial [Candidatus Accumulibacter sp.]|nr:GGDEF domain-containing protein [Accumulibacter sp.]